MMNKLFDKSAKLRSFRESVVGIDRIKDDPFEGDRNELEKYESVLRTVRSSINKYNTCLRELNHVHDEMMSDLKSFYALSESATQRRQIDMIESATKSVADFHQGGQASIEKTNQLIDSLLTMHVGLGNRLRDRDRAHAMKSHYDTKVGALKAKNPGSETNIVDAKVDRNEKKQREAMEEYEKSEQVVIRECRDALNTKFKDVDHVMGMYLKYLVEYHDGVGSSFKALKSLPAEMMTTARPDCSKPTVVLDEGYIPSAPIAVAPVENISDSGKEHNELRAALGLRLKGQTVAMTAAPAQVVEDDSDNDSDLSTPPPR